MIISAPEQARGVVSPGLQMHGRYYVYCLIDPRTNRTFYVGKGQGKRAWAHEAGVRAGRPDCNARKRAIIAELIEAGLTVDVLIVRRFDDAVEALAYERELIDTTPGITNDRRGYDAGTRLADRLRHLRVTAKARIERAERQATMIRKRLEEVRRVTRDPRRLAEAEAWIRLEVKTHLMQRVSAKANGTTGRGGRRIRHAPPLPT